MLSSFLLYSPYFLLVLLCIFLFFSFVPFFFLQNTLVIQKKIILENSLVKLLRNDIQFFFFILFSLFHSTVPAFLPLENHKLLTYTLYTLHSLADGFEKPSYSEGTNKIEFSTADVIKKNLSFYMDLISYC